MKGYWRFSVILSTRIAIH